MKKACKVDPRRFQVADGLLREFCRKHEIRLMALFGSVLREDFDEKSDIDVLVEFEAGRRIGLIGLELIAEELSGLLGRRVDLNTKGTLSVYFQDEVLREAEVVYDAA